MNSLSRASFLGLVSLVLAGCQSVSVPDIKSRFSAMTTDSSSYVVRPGETLDSIAFRYDLPVATLLRLNPVAANGVYSGMHLNLHNSSVPATQSARISGLHESAPQIRPAIQQNAIVETAPAPSQQAVPIAPLSPSQLRPDTERFNRPLPDAVSARGSQNQNTGYVQQPGFPVEEVIEDDNFLLPSSIDTPVNANSYVANNELEEFIGGWQWPLGGQLARSYDPQRANGRGIEIVGMPGQQIYVTRDGIVDWVARSPDGVGKVVIVRHDDDYLSIYSNAQDLYVTMGDVVRQGDPIASLGANFNDEPLLRFEISRNGSLLNPMDFLAPR